VVRVEREPEAVERVEAVIRLEDLLGPVIDAPVADEEPQASGGEIGAVSVGQAVRGFRPRPEPYPEIQRRRERVPGFRRGQQAVRARVGGIESALPLQHVGALEAGVPPRLPRDGLAVQRRSG